MGVIDDVRKWLNDVPLWKEFGTILDRTRALEEKAPHAAGYLAADIF